MGITKAEKAINDFNSEVTALAIQQIDKKELAKKLKSDFKNIYNNLNNKTCNLTIFILLLFLSINC